MTATAKDHFESGDLQDAIKAMNAEVKSKPGDFDKRGFLAELLCFDGNLERADRMLDLMIEQAPASVIGIALFRQLVRAEMARQEFFKDGRVPEFLDDPPPYLQLHLRASITLRDGSPTEAAALLAEAEEQRPRLAGVCDGKPFEDMRDLDDMTASIFEVLTSNGKYYWIPMARVTSVTLHPPERPRDLIWRRASMDVAQGPHGDVYLPVIYPSRGQEVDDRTRLGRVTDFAGGKNGGPVAGVGQRTWLIGDDAMPILQIGSLEFAGGDA